MRLTKNKETAESRAYWKFIEETAEQVRHWPKWMGGEGKEPLCCPSCNRPYNKKKPLGGNQ